MKKLVASALMALCLVSVVWGDAAPVTLKYILAPGDGTDLSLVLQGAPDNTGVRILLDGNTYLGDDFTQSTVRRVSPSASGTTTVQVSGFGSAAGVISTQTTHTDSSAGTASIIVDATSNTLKIRRPAEVYISHFSTEPRSDLDPTAGTQAGVLSLNVPIGSDPVQIGKQGHRYGVSVNGGAEIPLALQAGGLIKAGQYVLKDGKIVFPLSNLKDRSDSVALTVDGVPSNTFVTSQRTDWLQGLSKVESATENGAPVLRVYLNKSDALTDVSNLNVLVNGATVDKSTAATFGNTLVVKVKLLDLPATTRSITFQVTDPATGRFSDIVPVDVSDWAFFAITKVTITGADTPLATVNLYAGDGHLLAGDINQYTFTLNGVQYGPLGFKEALTNADGTAKTDINGLTLYRMARIIPLRREVDHLTFPIDATLLKDTNVFVLHDGNRNVDAQKVTFTRAGVIVPDAASVVGGAGTGETATFTAATDLHTSLDFVNTTVGPLKMGTLALGQLNPDAQYELSFTAATDADHTPFSSFIFAGEPLVTAYEKSGSVSYGYVRRAKGSDFSASSDFSWTPNGVRSEGPFTVRFTAFSLRKLGEDSVYQEVARLPPTPTSSFAWSYHDTGCWDGGTEYCNAAGYGDPSLTVDFSASGVPVVLTDTPVVKTPVVVLAPVVVATVTSQKPSIDDGALRAVEPPLNRAQKLKATRTAASLVAWCRAKAQGDVVRTASLANLVASAVEAKLGTVADPALRANLRAVASIVRAQVR